MKTPVNEKLETYRIIVASKNNYDRRPRIHKCKRSKYRTIQNPICRISLESNRSNLMHSSAESEQK